MLLPDLQSLMTALENLRTELEKLVVKGSVDDILKRGFWLANPHLKALKQATAEELEAAGLLVASFEKLAFFRRLWLRKKYSQSKKRRQDVVNKRAKEFEIETAAFKKYELANKNNATQKVDLSKRSSNHLLEIEKLEKRLSRMNLAYTQPIQLYGDRALGFTCEETMLPSETAQRNLIRVTQQLEVLENFARLELPKRVAQANVSHAALRIHDEFLAENHLPEISGSDSAAYALASSKGIERQLKHPSTSTENDPQARLNIVFRAAVIPGIFSRPEAWITFWTAIKATTAYHLKAYGAGYAEDAFSLDWCNAWEQQIRDWQPNLCTALGWPDGYVHAARGTFLNKKAETKTGADIMLALCTNSNGSVRVRLAFIQFKRDDRKTDKIDIWQDGVQQFECLEKMHRPDLGSFSMHALLSVRNRGLASIPAVSIPESKAAINRNYGFGLLTSAKKWKATGCDVDWRDCGESFPTLLTETLCGQTSAAFDGVTAAFKWLSDSSGLSPAELPKYMIFQAVGQNARGLTKSMELEGTRWAKELGLSLDGPSRGMSVGR